MMQNPHYEVLEDKGPKGDKGDPGPSGTFTTPTADVSFGNFKITNLGAPRDGTDAVNKNYADNRYIRAGEQINMRGMRITNMDAPIYPADAATKAYVEDGFYKKNIELNMNSNKITNVGTPTNTTDAANKNYVDTAIALSEMIVNKKLIAPFVKFQHFFPNKIILFLWFNFSVGSTKISTMQPANAGLNNTVKLYIRPNLSVDYIFNRTLITFIRTGSESLVLDSIGYVYKI